MTTIQAPQLLPAASVGVMTMLGIQYPPERLDELLLIVGILGPLEVSLTGLGIWLWRRPPEKRYFGLSGRTWVVLQSLAFVIGFLCMAIP